MRVLVTGGAGYIGTATSKKLLDEGHQVIILDSLINGHSDTIDPRAKFARGCLSDKDFLDRIFKKNNFDAVIHFAGFIEAGDSMKKPDIFFGNNVINGMRLLDAMVRNNVKKIIYSSSAGVYSADTKKLKETSEKEPASVYGETKLMFERVLKWYDEIHGIKYTSLRYFNASGCWNELGERHEPETHLIPLIIFAALGKRDSIKIFGTDYKTRDGTCVRDYIDIQDLAEAHLLALISLKDKSTAYNVGTGKGKSVREVINAVKKITGQDFPVIEEKRRAGDPAILVADSSKIKKELGWKPKVSFEQGLDDAIRFFQKQLFK